MTRVPFLHMFAFANGTSQRLKRLRVARQPFGNVCVHFFFIHERWVHVDEIPTVLGGAHRQHFVTEPLRSFCGSFSSQAVQFFVRGFREPKVPIRMSSSQ